MLSSEDNELLQGAGTVFLQDISSLVALSVLYGLYVSLFALGIRALLARKPRTKYTWILFGFLSVLFLYSTLNFAMNVTIDLGLIRGALVKYADLPLVERFAITDASLMPFLQCLLWFGTGSSGCFLFSFADAVVVWRACVLWPSNKAVKTVLFLLLFASFGSSIASGVMHTVIGLGGDNVLASSALGIIDILNFSISLATNVVATALIGFKAYQYRKMMKATIGLKNSKSNVVLLCLTESGIVFCVLQTICLGLSLHSGPPNVALMASTIWEQLSAFAAAAYPIVVIIIVDSHRSISDHTGITQGDSGFSAEAGGNPAGPQGGFNAGTHISFAAAAQPGDSGDIEASQMDVVASRGYDNSMNEVEEKKLG